MLRQGLMPVRGETRHAARREARKPGPACAPGDARTGLAMYNCSVNVDGQDRLLLLNLGPGRSIGSSAFA